MVTQVVWPATGDTSLHPKPYSFHQLVTQVVTGDTSPP